MASHLEFNSNSSSTMHIDLNSCFATIEQQANPNLRGRPIAICAYDSPGGCILAPSIEAKRFGVKTGMRLKDGKKLCPFLISMPSDPNKYRFVHQKLNNILSDYTPRFSPKSIDEFVLDLSLLPKNKTQNLISIANEIKIRIKEEIGEHLTVSIGISTNRTLAKLASSLHKPDGLDVIDKNSFEAIYKKLKLTDLPGINIKTQARLYGAGIYDVWQMYNSQIQNLNKGFRSILSFYWYLRLRGYQVDEIDLSRKSFGNSYSLPIHNGKKSELYPILQKLAEKTGSRMRRKKYFAKGVHVSLYFRDKAGYWHEGHVQSRVLFDSREIFAASKFLLQKAPELPVHTIAITCFDLKKDNILQLELFDNREKKLNLISAIDNVNEKFGANVVMSANLLYVKDKVLDRIGFGQSD